MKYKIKRYVIAVDGPSGSGKSTIAKELAHKSGFLYIDSGAMYRAVTLSLLKKELLGLSARELYKHLKGIKIEFVNKKNKQLIFLNSKDVTKEIRSNRVSKLVSEVSSRKLVRQELVKRQRGFAKSKLVIMDGRDIGTNVFKNANLKIYLTASPLIRAKRRLKDLKKLGEKVSIKNLIKEIQARDDYDSSRAISPLCKAQDAIVIDTSKLSINEVLEKIVCFLPCC